MISILSKLLSDAERVVGDVKADDENTERFDASGEEVIDINFEKFSSAWELFFNLNDIECFQDDVLLLKDNQKVRINRLLLGVLFEFVAKQLRSSVQHNFTPKEYEMKDVSHHELVCLIDILKSKVKQVRKKDIERYIEITERYGFVKSVRTALLLMLNDKKDTRAKRQHLEPPKDDRSGSKRRNGD